MPEPRRLPLRNVLVAIDSSDAGRDALRRALALPLGRGATLHVLHVLDERPGSRADVDAAARIASRLARARGRADLGVRVHRTRGEPWQEVALHSRLASVDLLVVGRTGSGSPRSDGIGSTTRRLVLVAGVPVLVVGGAPAGPYERPLVALDLQIYSVELLRLALRVAGTARGGVPVLHAFDVSFEATRSGGTRLNSWGHKFLREARGRLDEILEVLAEPPPTWDAYVLPGPPGSTIAREAVRRAADLVIVGTHAPAGLPRLLTGSVATEVLEGVRCDVLVARHLPEAVAFPPRRSPAVE